MAPKRPLEAGENASAAQKKPRHGFRVGPENLPDGPWRRKVTKIKKQLIHKAKVKKAYAKIKAREQNGAKDETTPQEESDQASEEGDDDAAKTPGEQMHPTRHLMLRDEEVAQASGTRRDDDDQAKPHSDGQRRRTRRPGYYDKQLKRAEDHRLAAEERNREFERRREEREKKLAERERSKRAWAKTRDKDGKKKLGRESVLLLDKVKKLVAEK
ncbi:hypothetical protein S7711_00410 [Stachybotrys chartarum IBT 7711]|uniref:rRNA-processing protein FYV7 n=1 Tax=Stachybotrys chartarum (strain CBS 109288 / IBT 7711) TaxID=1280523 RepID=A0A084B9M4_STACB|nr:hypothetical protein S7711_00410 [Stachybotrys chartarum IBT 7711]KFA49058.1 hypothetical protein S40293_07954 [Stachybotrys chartarum IBT 40293]KFA77922.1 hypothetical protein S40288_02482 [Stachybotrys chartarum IBT 40288]